MRRRSDDWINATHILKAVGFDKPARTRILERDVQKLPQFEKIQGGYGKYQGQYPSLHNVVYMLYCTRDLLLTIGQAHGFLSPAVQIWLGATMSTINLPRSSNFVLATIVLLPLRNIRPISRKHRRSLLFLNSTVSFQEILLFGSAKLTAKKQRPQHLCARLLTTTSAPNSMMMRPQMTRQ